MAVLELIFGPMFAGKSCELIRKIRILKVLKKNYLILKPKTDTRYIDGMVVSHNLDKEECIMVEKLSDIFTLDKYITNEIDTIFIDEGQFFSDLEENVLLLVEKYNKNVIVAGLLVDSKRKQFGQILNLIPIADKLTPLSSMCLQCMNGTPVIFSHRNETIADPCDLSQGVVLIGESDIYSSVCRKHYIEQN